jgi:hypothetical protein
MNTNLSSRKIRISISDDEVHPVLVFVLKELDTSNGENWDELGAFANLSQAFCILGGNKVTLSTFRVCGDFFNPITLQNF